MADTPEVVLYSRPNCHLCDEARAVIEHAIAAHGGSLREVNIDEDAQLQAQHGEFVPVVMVAQRQIGYWRIDESRLIAALTTPDVDQPMGTDVQSGKKSWWQKLRNRPH